MMRKTELAPILRKTDDYQAMRSLALRSGLEDGTYNDFVVAYGYFLNDRLVGCAGLKVQNGVYLVESMAVDEMFRGKGMGRALAVLVEHEAKARGAKEIWAIARAPEFFERVGYHREEPRESGGPSLKNCLACRQYKVSCEPAIVMKALKD